MKILNRAYTLAEVLVVLAIVGIAASLTVPALVSNSKTRINSNSLSRAVNVVENGMQSILTAARQADPAIDSSASSIHSLSMVQYIHLFGEDADDEYLLDDGVLLSNTRAFTGLEECNNAYLANVRNYSRGAMPQGFSNLETYKLPKQNSIVIYEAPDADDIEGITPDTVISKLYIDANGEQTPNRIGQDIFLFGLTDSGKLVPAGTDAYNTNLFDEEIDLYNDETAGADSCLNDSITDGFSCAARVMADSWQIKY